MKEMLLVGAGGFIGAVARFQISRWVSGGWNAGKFPAGTLLVNLTGCLLIGVIAGWLEKRGGSGEGMRLFWITGMLGGYTTFSAFSWESLHLLRHGHFAVCAGYVLASLLGGLAAVWLGWKWIG